MAFFFSKQSKQPKKAHLNWMDGVSYDITDPIVRLRLSASTCFFGEPMYYHHADHVSATRTNQIITLNADALAYLRETLNAVSPAEWRDMSPAALLEKTIDDALRHDAAIEIRIFGQTVVIGDEHLVPLGAFDRSQPIGLVQDILSELKHGFE